MEADIVVIGGGIVGLATAWRLQTETPCRQVIVVEKEPAIAQHQTGHNSGVIHSGIYYKPGSAKAQNCVRGYRQLLAFCEAERVPYTLCGKLLVATDSREEAALAGLRERGEANGLTGIQEVPKEALADYEPHVAGRAALWVPQTGIIDYQQVAKALAQRFQEAGGRLELGQPVLAIRQMEAGVEVVTPARTVRASLLINCGGLHSDRLARLAGMTSLDLRIVPFRGEYYTLRPEREHLVRGLIYPVPDPAFPFLGVHFTRMIGGGVEAGPNAVFAARREGYSKLACAPRDLWESLTWPGFQQVARKYWRTGLGEIYRSLSKAAFTRALQKLIPELRADDLLPGGAGVRAQACSRDGKLIDDFLILEDRQAIHVGNAPSPAATSSLSIGQTIAELAQKRF